MAEKGLRELYVDELRDLYNAENQLVKALPKMAKGASSTELRSGFEEHLQQTKGHVQRLETIFRELKESSTGKKCKGMEGVIEEGAEVLEEDGDENVLDLGIIGAGSRVEHYEMAGYTTAINLAKQLGNSEVASLLSESLKEEEAADEKLRKIGQQLLRQAPVNATNQENRKKMSASGN